MAARTRSVASLVKAAVADPLSRIVVLSRVPGFRESSLVRDCLSTQNLPVISLKFAEDDHCEDCAVSSAWKRGLSIARASNDLRVNAAAADKIFEIVEQTYASGCIVHIDQSEKLLHRPSASLAFHDRIVWRGLRSKSAKLLLQSADNYHSSQFLGSDIAVAPGCSSLSSRLSFVQIAPLSTEEIVTAILQHNSNVQGPDIDTAFSSDILLATDGCETSVLELLSDMAGADRGLQKQMLTEMKEVRRSVASRSLEEKYAAFQRIYFERISNSLFSSRLASAALRLAPHLAFVDAMQQISVWKKPLFVDGDWGNALLDKPVVQMLLLANVLRVHQEDWQVLDAFTPNERLALKELTEKLHDALSFSEKVAFAVSSVAFGIGSVSHLRRPRAIDSV